MSCGQSLQLSPHIPQVLDDLTHLIRWKLPSTPILDQGLRSFYLKPKNSSSASFNRYPSAELLGMDQFLIHRSPGRVRWEENCFLIERQPTCPSRLEIPLGVHALIHHTASSTEVSSDRINFGLRQTCSPIPA
jgi:hypothetical protein